MSQNEYQINGMVSTLEIYLEFVRGIDWLQ